MLSFYKTLGTRKELMNVMILEEEEEEKKKKKKKGDHLIGIQECDGEAVQFKLRRDMQIHHS